jgi:hypothetical protein
MAHPGTQLRPLLVRVLASLGERIRDRQRRFGIPCIGEVIPRCNLKP